MNDQDLPFHPNPVSHNRSDEAPGITYIAVAELPKSFEKIAEWVDVVLRAHAHVLHMRVVVDFGGLEVEDPPPSVEYLDALADVLRPLTKSAAGSLCALVVPSQPLLWRARVFESITSGSRIRFRAFDSHEAAVAWLDSSDEGQANAG